MENLRIVNVEVKSSQDLTIQFTHNLSSGISVSNINIISNTTSVPDSSVLSVKIKDNLLFIRCQPLTPFITYSIKALKTINYPFISKDNKASLLQDNIGNVFNIIGPIEKENIFKQLINESLKDGVYNLADNTIVSTIIDSMSKNLDSALDAIKDLKNENYVSFDVIDELKSRGSGPFDKLNEGSAYEILRVAPRPTNTTSVDTFIFNSSNYKLVSLQETYNSEILLTNSIDSNGFFNILNFNLNLSKNNIIRIKSIVFTLSTSNPIYTYNIEKYGYQILDEKYDPDFASKYFLLESNQIKLNEEILNDPDFDIAQIVKVDVEYYYKNTGKLIYNPEIFARKNIVREVIPSITSNFMLKHGNIIDEDNEIYTSGGLTFIDLNSRSNHPAFLYEIKFRYEELPFAPGQYSVNYETGNIFVYGESSSNLGTGAKPPVVSYTYKKSFESEVDYVYDPETFDLAILPKGKAIDQTIYVNYSFEIVYVKDLDYKSNLHEESLNERINNNLVALNVLKTSNYPITNVFRIYNETSGELYTLSRFDGDKVYFRYTTPPNISQSEESVDFHLFSEKIIPVSYSTNTNSIIVAKIQLSKQNIISSTNDRIGNYLNSSLVLDNNIFIKQKNYLDDNSLSLITTVGDYLVDYELGFIFVGVSSLTIEDFGQANYKYNSIDPQFSHVLYVNELYYSQPSTEKIQVTVSEVSDNIINISNLALSTEDNINNSPYLLINNKVGYFENSSFVNKVKNEVSNIFGLYEYSDFINSTNPINFSQFSSFLNKSIEVGTFSQTYFEPIQYSTDGYFVEIPKVIFYSSSNCTYGASATIVASNIDVNINSISIEESTNKIFLDTTSLGTVKLILEVSINNLSRVVVDYSRGTLIANYNYLADEILINYEYGSNSLDFRESNISSGAEYYVSYKVGALRDALIKNFSTLINVDDLSNIDPSFDRERYRDGIYAALSSFILGPTIPAIKNIVKQIVHTEPRITESAFSSWSLGQSTLSPQDIQASEFTLLPAKHGDGVLVNSGHISFPSFNNFNLEEGSMGFWIVPQWDGLDNLATLNVSVLEDNLAIDTDKIFIGATEEHPESNIFSLDKSIVFGSPNTNKDGIYFYLDKDESNLFNRWYVKVVDGYSTITNDFKITLESEFYDFRTYDGYPTSILTTNNKIVIKTNDSFKQDLYGFIADNNKYFVDIKKENSRFSIYKDKSGYLVFEVIDRKLKKHKISHYVGSWKNGEAHQIYTAWKINSKNHRDELHLFVDGVEVSNVLNYSSNVRNYLHQDFRTVAKETFVGVAGKDIVGSIDLTTTVSSNIVSSLINFAAYNISIGDRIFIFNDLFNSNGYEITNISGQDLELDSNMPVSLTDLEFSVNKTIFDGYGRYYLNTNNYFYKLSYYYDGYDLSSNDTNIVTSSIDFTNIVSSGDLIRITNTQEDYYTILSVSGSSLILDSDIPTNSNQVFYIYSIEEIELRSPRAEVSDYNLEKDQIIIKNNLNSNELLFSTSLGLNHEVIKSKYYQWSDNLSNIIKTQLPKPTSIEEVIIYKYLLNNTIVNSTNSIVSGSNFVSELITDNPINSQSGRKILITISGTNLVFPLTVQIYGNVNYINIIETLTFNDYFSLESVNNYFSVDKLKISGEAININKNYLSINCRELESIFEPEVSYYTPVLNYSYVVNEGLTLEKLSDNSVIDYNNNFSISNVGNYLGIESPDSVAGFYRITGVNGSELEIESLSTGYVQPILGFTDGYYKIYNTLDTTSGPQNGFFNFEPLDYPGQAYFLRKGFYEFNYPTYLRIDFDLGDTVFIGSDYNKANHANSIINELAIYNTVLQDIRAGEESLTIESVTKNFNSIKGVKKSKNLIFLSKFDSYPFKNDADYYTADKDNNLIYSNISVNSNFSNSLYLNNRNIKVTNLGYLDSRKEGTIEFWTSPIFDTLYDYNTRYYFDSSSAISEEVISTTNKTLSLANKAKEILSVKTLNSDINYFAGGYIDLARKDSVNEIVTSSSSNKVVLTNQAKQILYVKINNFTNIDYFDDGSLALDGKTIYLNKSLPSNNIQVIVSYRPLNLDVTNEQVIVLGKKLPSNNTKVIVNYIPKGSNGDRISIYKSTDSYLTFEIKASNTIHSVKAPIIWEKNTWHKVKTSYKFNSNNENLLLFIDGYKYNTSSSTFLGNQNPYVYGNTIIGDGYDAYALVEPILFKDTLNYFTIGSDYLNKNYANVSIDNFRISNKYREPFKYLGESIDISYLGNSSLPVVKDLYTTYLLDSDLEYNLFEDFAVLINKSSGIFEFNLDIFDSFNILRDNPQSKLILEKLLNILKPANSRIFLNYI